MASGFDSFDSSGFDVYLTTAHFARGGGVIVVIGSALVNFTNPDQTFKSVSWLDSLIMQQAGDNILDENDISDLLEYKTKLYATSSSTSTFGEKLDGIGVYNKATGDWDDLPVLLGDPSAEEMCIWRGLLVIVGSFTSAGGVSNTLRGAAFDGANYFSIGLDSSTSPWGPSGLPANCIAIENTLIVSGQNIIRQYNGGGVGSWSELITGDPDNVTQSVLNLHDGKVILGAHDISFVYVREWSLGDAAYTTLGTFDISLIGFFNRVTGITTYQGDLVVCGGFLTMGALVVNGVARYNFEDDEWSAFGLGLGGLGSGRLCKDIMVDPEGNLLVVGDFLINGDGDSVRGFAKWNPAADKWDKPDTSIINGEGNTMTTFSGSLKFP